MGRIISFRLQGELLDLDLFVVWLAENGIAVEFESDRLARKHKEYGKWLRYMKLDARQIEESNHE